MNRIAVIGCGWLGLRLAKNLIENNYKVIGIMSGTSLDGIDLACVNFKLNKFWKFEIEATKTVSYSKQWITKLKELFSASKDLIKIGDESYTLFLAKNVLSFIKEFIQANKLSFSTAPFS